MSKSAPRPKSLIIFYLLVAYIIVQFIWWAYMMLDLHQAVFEQQSQIALLKDPTGDTAVIAEQMRGKMWMIIGESIVFIVILVLGILRIQRAFKKEVALANQQRNFLLSVTHELKSPIASAKLYLQTLVKRKDLSEERKQEMLGKAIKDTERLTSLVENILTATKIDNSSYPLHLEQTDVSTLTNEVLNASIETAGQDHPTKLNIDPQLMLSADPLAFTSILLNLYENAIKYSEAGTPIEVSLKKKGSDVVLTVKDSGIGISKADADRIFDKFYRAGSEETRQTKGTGLGLYIVKHLAALHNGEIAVRPNSPRGTIFEITYSGNPT